jgi:hypothetical protein
MRGPNSLSSDLFSPNLFTPGVLVNSFVALILRHISCRGFRRVSAETWGAAESGVELYSRYRIRGYSAASE